MQYVTKDWTVFFSYNSCNFRRRVSVSRLTKMNQSIIIFIFPYKSTVLWTFYYVYFILCLTPLPKMMKNSYRALHEVNLLHHRCSRSGGCGGAAARHTSGWRGAAVPPLPCWGQPRAKQGLDQGRDKTPSHARQADTQMFCNAPTQELALYAIDANTSVKSYSVLVQQIVKL